MFSVVRVARFATQRFDKHITAAPNQHAIIEEAVFSLAAVPRIYNEDLKHLRDDSELSFGVGSCSRELRESQELAVRRIMPRKELSCAKKTSCVIRSYSETVMNPLPGYD
jgi:hypothetical protein